MLSALADSFSTAQQWLFETTFAPLIRLLGLTEFMEDGFDAAEWFLLGGIEVLLLFALLRPLEKLRPAESEMHNAERRKAVRTDVIYTLLHRLGGFSLLAFFLLRPIADDFEGQLRLAGFERTSLDSLLPWLDNYALLQFMLYLVILDFADYWIHRGQHRIGKWWALHSLHHAQTHMTLWSDNRNHLLDDLVRDALLVALALLIGVEPGQFVWLLIASRAIQSLSHANVKMDFGGIGKYLIVSPQFHRVHHGIGIGHEGNARGVNFGVLFAWWDVLFGTADFKTPLQPTGVRDQLSGRQYGTGFWSQQWLGIKRLVNKA
jgi:sterol desaturase/sphingolipid hydroxylase (fatty acid hydroxylase superfamily)